MRYSSCCMRDKTYYIKIVRDTTVYTVTICGISLFG